MRARLIIVLLALLLATAATAGMAFYIAKVKADVTDGQKLVPVLVVKSAVEKGDRLVQASGSGAVVLAKVPKQYVAEGALNSISGNTERVFAVSLAPGEQVTANKFKKDNETGLAHKIPDGMVAMAVAVDEVTGVGGMLQVGDRVDVIATIGESADKGKSKIVLQGVELLATSAAGTGEQEGGFTKNQSSATGKNTVTLAVFPAYAEKLAFAVERGHIWLCLRQQGDIKTYETVGQTMETVTR